MIMMPKSRTPRKRALETGSSFSSASDHVTADLLAQLQSALTMQDRLAVLHKILDFLYPVCTHDSIAVETPNALRLAEAGLITLLVYQLNHALQHNGQEEDGTTGLILTEICRILSILVQHCSGRGYKVAMAELSNQHGLWLLASAMKCGIIGPVLAMLHILSTEPSNALMITQSRELLPLISRALAQDGLSEEDILEGLGSFKNISFYVEDLRRQFLCAPDVKDSLCTLTRTLRTEKSLERLSAVFRNFSVSKECRSIMVGDPEIVHALIHLSSRPPGYKILHRNLLNTFISLTLDHDACLVLVLFGNGVILNRIKGWLQDDDDVIRKRAARLLRGLANEHSGPMLVQDADLMDLISHRALQDENQAVRIEATEAFARCASRVQTGQQQYDVLLDALLRLTRMRNISSEALASALREQAARLDTRTAIAKCSDLLEAAAKVSTARGSTIRSKEDVCFALLDLAHDDENLECLAQPMILDALVYNATASESSPLASEPKRKASIQAMLRLASCPMNRPTMVNHHGLMESLIRYAATAPDLESKRQIKATILSLVGEL